MIAAVAGATLAALIAVSLPVSASARPDDDAVLSPLGMSIANPPNPVLGADGLNHLAYEITIVNQSSSEVTINQVQPLARGKPFGAPLGPAELDGLLRVNPGVGQPIPPGGSALLFMDVTYARKAPAPKGLTHAFNTTLHDPSGAQPDQTIDFTGVRTTVGQEPPIEVGAPLRGSGWVVGNGCCNPINAHRGATLSIDGTVRVPERFAIDFVRIDDSGHLFEGPIDQLSSYAYFGAQVHSVAPGKVVNVTDGYAEQVPGELPTGQTVQTAGGNHIVVRLRSGEYAFYAHLQPGSPTVEVGNRVRKGEVLGLLGNTGNSDGPHLHFHIMDGPSPLQSNGLPFVYKRFTGQGLVTNIGPVQQGAQAQIAPSLVGSFKGRMPLGNELIAFGGS